MPPASQKRKRNIGPTLFFALLGILGIGLTIMVLLRRRSLQVGEVFLLLTGIACLFTCLPWSTSQTNWATGLLLLLTWISVIVSGEGGAFPIAMLIFSIPVAAVLFYPIESEKFADCRPFRYVQEELPSVGQPVMSPTYLPSSPVVFTHESPSYHMPQGQPSIPPPQYHPGTSTLQPDHKR